MSRRSVFLSRVLLATLLTFLLSLPALADSQIRMVRLSLVEGDVQAGHYLSPAYQKALLNVPIVQGMTLKTGEGRAEVEFEDGSTVRLGPNTLLEFITLSRRDSGALVSAVRLDNGIVYLDCKSMSYVKLSGGALSGSQGDDFSLLLGKETVRPEQKAHFRVQSQSGKAELGVFDGEVAVQGAAGDLQVGKKQSARFDLAADQYLLAKKLDSNPLDAWDKEQTKYHDTYLLASSQQGTNSPYGYGMSDLSYYGDFFNMAGYGLLWQPYFTGAGWNPFMYGAWMGDPCTSGWMWDPSCGGYMWVSGYPWGWLPYHYGSWIYVANRGWAWQPGSFQTWRPVPPVMRAPQGFVAPRPPAGIVRSPVFVDRRPMGIRTSFSRAGMTIHNGSAGLGVPRGSVENLQRVSQRVESHGFANTGVRSPMMAPGMPGARQTWNGARPGFSRAQGPPMASRAGRSAPRMSAPPAASRPSYAPSSGYGGGGGFHPSGGGGNAGASPRR